MSGTIGSTGKVAGVDVEGRFLGWVDPSDPRLFKAVVVTPVSADPQRYDFTRDVWVRVWPVDADGIPCAEADAATLATTPPPTQAGFVWSEVERAWVDRRSPRERADEYRAQAIQVINAFLTKRAAQIDTDTLRQLIVGQQDAMATYWRSVNDEDMAKLMELARDLCDAIHDPVATTQDQAAAWTHFNGQAMRLINPDLPPE